MKKYAVAIAFSLLLTLTGCKLEHNSRVKQSQLLGNPQTLQTALRIEVPACSDYKDKTQPSKALLDTTQIVEQLFSDAEFDGCKNEGMESLATYFVPMEVGTLPPDAKSYTPKGISVIRNQNGVVFFALSEEIRQKIAEAKKDHMSSKLALNVIIKLTNDTEQELKIFPHAIYVEGTAFAGLPAWDNNSVIPSKKTATIVLSNVASDYALNTGLVPVFSEAQKQEPKE